MYGILWIGFTNHLSARIHAADKDIAHVGNNGLLDARGLDELVKRANCYADMLAALERIAESWPGGDLEANNYERQQIARAALAKVKGGA